MLSLTRALARRSTPTPRGFIAPTKSDAAFFSALRSKGELLDEIMAWRTKFVERKGANPTQDDIAADPAGVALLQEWQAVEKAEEDSMPGSEMGRVEPLDPAIAAKKEEVQSQLMDWREQFEAENGRRPTRDDMFGDPVAAELFSKFQSFTELDWPAEMRLLLNADLTPPSQ